MTILITGAGGQVGHSLLSSLQGFGKLVAADIAKPASLPSGVDFRAADFSDAKALVALMRAVRPSIVVNPAAYTAVDKAESEAETARLVNAVAPGVLAEEAARIGAAFVHYSTDYVFDGSGQAPRTEDAPTGPLGVYGRTKLEGEEAVLRACPGAVVLRTAWVFSDHGHNFVKTMLKLGTEREQLKVVADQIGAPTSAAFLATMTARVLKSLQASPAKVRELGGVYHLICAGETSWHGFATEIFKQARAAGRELKVKEVLPIATEEYPTPARRPKNSRLSCDKFKRTFDVPSLQTWQSALTEVMQKLLPKA